MSAELSGNDALFVAALTAAVTGSDLDSDAQDWFKQAIVRHFNEGTDLASCLGINSTRGRIMRKQRDHYIMQAVAAQSGESRTSRCEQFHSKLNRFATTKWPTWKDNPPASIDDELERCCFNILKFEQLGIAIPGVRSIYNICTTQN